MRTLAVDEYLKWNIIFIENAWNLCSVWTFSAVNCDLSIEHIWKWKENPLATRATMLHGMWIIILIYSFVTRSKFIPMCIRGRLQTNWSTTYWNMNFVHASMLQLLQTDDENLPRLCIYGNICNTESIATTDVRYRICSFCLIDREKFEIRRISITVFP